MTNQTDEFLQKVCQLQAQFVQRTKDQVEACRLLTKSGASPCQLPANGQKKPTNPKASPSPTANVLKFSRARAVIQGANGPFHRPRSCQLV